MFRGTPCFIRNILASWIWFRIEGEKCQPANFFALRTHILYCLPLNCYQKQPIFRKCNLFVIFEKNSKCLIHVHELDPDKNGMDSNTCKTCLPREVSFEYGKCSLLSIDR